MQFQGGVGSLLQDKVHTLNDTQKKIALFLLEHPDEIKGLELNELATLTSTSRSSVLRFLQSLGFSGLRDFKQQCASFKSPTVDLGSPLLTWLSDSTDTVVKQTVAALDLQALKRAVEHCAKATRIFWYGAGESGLLAEQANYRCWLMGIDSNFCREMGNFSDFSHRIGSAEVVVVVSRSGNGDHIEKPLESIKEKNTFVIGVTTNRLSWLAQNASLCLFTTSEAACIENRRIPIRAGCELVNNALILGTGEMRNIDFQLGETN